MENDGSYTIFPFINFENDKFLKGGNFILAVKEFKTRLTQKHDTEQNWNKATNFKPLLGEIIVYDQDESHTQQRIKIGDGNTLISDLPFVDVNESYISGESQVSITDTSEAEHLMDVNLKSKNLFDKDTAEVKVWYMNTTTSSCLITNATNGRMIYLPCQPNTTYTMSKTAGQVFYLGWIAEEPALDVDVPNRIIDNTASSITITTGANALYLVSYFFNAAQDTITLDEMLSSIQIERGTSATSYTPYISDFSSVNVKRYGKNLFDSERWYNELKAIDGNNLNILGTTVNGIEYYQLRPNILYAYKFMQGEFLPNAVYTLTYKAKNISTYEAPTGIRFVYTDDTSDTFYISGQPGGDEVTETLTSAAGKTVDAITLSYRYNAYILVRDIQVELGATATSYEPYNGATYTANADGTVDNVISLSQNNTLIADTEGVIINCKYLNSNYSELQHRQISYASSFDNIIVEGGSAAEAETESNNSKYSWTDIQQLVRSGLASEVFSIGDQLVSAKGDSQLVWDIIGFDHDVPADSQFNHSMTIQLHDCYDYVQFDAIEALYYCSEELPAGTYNFTLLAGYDTAYGGGKTYQFTLTKAVPAGGQIMFPWLYHTQASTVLISTYESATSTTAIESVSIIEGSDGTSLGTANGKTENMNHSHRIRYGSNRWLHSSIRQWLNSNKAASAWWKPQNIFDRPPSNASTAGFLTDMDDEFLSAIGEVTKRTALDTVTDGGGYEDTKELMFLLSCSELYGGLVNNVNEGAPYPYYANYSDLSAPGTAADNNRIKYRAGSAQYWWQRSCGAGDASTVRRVIPSGIIDDYVSCNSIRVTPACNII